jgi:hypothetical protein
MIKRFVLLSALAVAVALAGGSRLAAQEEEGELIFELSDGHLTRILQNLGYEEIEVIDKTDDTSTFRFVVDERKVLLMSYREQSDIRVFIYFVNDAGVTRSTLTTINEWNRDQRWSKAYLDSEGDWTLEADFDVQPGVTEAAIEAFIKLWVSTIDRFVEHIE